jgi:NAD(P)-dependent dehydrogenase (short-subunit alcohol dehydrogenase family)
VRRSGEASAVGRLAGKVALITGAGQGMGATAARLFAHEGARVAVNDLNPAGEATAEAIAAEGGEAMWAQADVTDATQTQAMVDAVMNRYGRIDVLYNNAGIGPPDDALIHELPEHVWDRVMSVNVRGMYLCTRATIAAMLSTRRSRVDASIINTASIAGIVGNQTLPSTAYTVSKGAVMALTRQVAVSYAARGIRCNAVCPGPIETPILEPYFARPGIRRKFQKRIPLGRLGQPEDVANLALFLASDESSFITGSLIVIDGGITAT